jgi:hypothetical protein
MLGSMLDSESLTQQAVRRQLAAMPNKFYLIRLIHSVERKPAPAKRLWTAEELARNRVVHSLRADNRLGFNVYLWPYAERRNAGYILLDLDHARPDVLQDMRIHGHEPCVVLETSAGHLQAWSTSAPSRWSRQWPPLWAGSWPSAMAASGQAPIGATWAVWPASAISSRRHARLRVWRLRFRSSMLSRSWPLPCSNCSMSLRNGLHSTPSPGADSFCDFVGCHNPGARGGSSTTHRHYTRRRGGRVSALASALPHSPALPPARLEHRRSLAGQQTACSTHTPGSGHGNPAPGQPGFSSQPWRCRRLPAPHLGASRAIPSPPCVWRKRQQRSDLCPSRIVRSSCAAFSGFSPIFPVFHKNFAPGSSRSDNPRLLDL